MKEFCMHLKAGIQPSDQLLSRDGFFGRWREINYQLMAVALTAAGPENRSG
jgi:hypothetical protein